MLRIFAPKVSTFGRAVAMTAEEAGLAWDIVPTPAGAEENRARHPFLKAPSVEIDGVTLYETVAICQYLDDRFNGGALQPADPLERARMSQWFSVAVGYVFPATEVGLILPRVVAPLMGREPREDVIARALPTIAYQVDVIEARLQESAHLAGPALSLADIALFCVLAATQAAPEGRQILAARPALTAWLETLHARACARATVWDLKALVAD